MTAPVPARPVPAFAESLVHRGGQQASATADDVEKRLERLEVEHAALKQQLTNILDLVSAPLDTLHNRKWTPKAYSRHSRLHDGDQRNVLQSLVARDVRLVFPSDLDQVLGPEVTP